MKTDKELILEHCGIEEWQDTKKISMIRLKPVLNESDQIRVEFDKWGFMKNPDLEVVETTLLELLKDDDFIKGLRIEELNRFNP